MSKKISRLIKAIFLCEMAGVIGSFFTTPAINGWYFDLSKPSFNPPNWVFAPVWAILFALMGVALYIVWDKGEDMKDSPLPDKKGEMKKIRSALKIFLAQLALNISWSFIFFCLHSPFYAFLEIILLWFAILASIIAFYRINKISAFLLFPYIFWVSYAAILNFFIFALNR